MSTENQKVRRKQYWIMGIAAAVLLIVAVPWILSDPKSKKDRETRAKQERVDLSGLVQAPAVDQAVLMQFGDRMDGFEETASQMKDVLDENATLKTELAEMRAEHEKQIKDARATLEAYGAVVNNLESQLGLVKTDLTQTRILAQKGPQNQPDSTRPPIGSQAPFRQVGSGGQAQPVRFLAAVAAPEVQSVNFQLEGENAGEGPELGELLHRIPVNAYAPAKVLVGVDVRAAVGGATDPLPVLLRILGPAQSVYNDGRIYETDLTGCLVNGAAHGDLSSEKVYVKLQKITCAQSPTEVAEAVVEGYVAYGGKTGVRGRVVSREGDIVTKALIAGAAEGLGNAFAADTRAQFGSVGIGAADTLGLNAEEIARGSVGGGISTAAGTLSEYLIQRAEQYQPVIEMPTGIDVELVFLAPAEVRMAQN